MEATSVDIVLKRQADEARARQEEQRASRMEARRVKLAKLAEITRLIAEIHDLGIKHQWPAPFSVVVVAHPKPPRLVTKTVTKGKWLLKRDAEVQEKVYDDLACEQVVGVPLRIKDDSSISVGAVHWGNARAGNSVDWLVDEHGILWEAEYPYTSPEGVPCPSMKSVLCDEASESRWHPHTIDALLETLRKIVAKLAA